MRLGVALIVALVGHACGGGPKQVTGDDGPPPKAVVVYLHANAAAKDGRFAKAAALFDEAVRLDPESIDARLAAGRMRAQLGDWKTAIERTRGALALAKSDPDHERAYRQLARYFLAAGRQDDAAKTYRDRIASHPDDARAHFRLGEILIRKGDYEEAEAALSQATSHEPKLAAAWVRLGELLERQRRAAAAARAWWGAAEADPEQKQHLTRALRLALEGGDHALARDVAARISGHGEGESWRGALALAELLFQRQDYIGAVNELEFVLQMAPNEQRARLMLALILARVQRYDDAIIQLTAVPLDHEQGVDAARLHIQLLIDQARYSDAVAVATTARAVRPDEARLAFDHARAHRAGGELDRAQDVLGAAVEHWPDAHEIRYMLGIVLHDRGKRRDAVAAMEGILARAPEHPGALNFVGYSWAERGENLEKAEMYIRRALEARPDDGAIVDSLGWVLYRRGYVDQAETVLRRALLLAPNEAEIQFHLAEVLLKLGKQDEAVQLFENAARGAKEESLRKLYERRLRRLRRGR